MSHLLLPANERQAYKQAVQAADAGSHGCAIEQLAGIVARLETSLATQWKKDRSIDFAVVDALKCVKDKIHEFETEAELFHYDIIFCK